MLESTLLVVLTLIAQSPLDSLPAAGDRAVAVTGLVEEEIVIAVDAAGVPWVSADTLDGLYQGEGFMHGQDRFFQMDLMLLRGGEMAAAGPPMLSAPNVCTSFDAWRSVPSTPCPMPIVATSRSTPTA